MGLDQLQIPNSREIRGNITLPKFIQGMPVQWESSRPEVITDKPVGKKAPGVVTRQEEDTEVLLTATLSDGTKRVFEVLVKAACKPLAEEDFEGYLFGHFIGEGGPLEEQIYFALSTEGMHFCDLNDRKPILISSVGEKGVRDPFLYRSAEGDRFFLVATDLSIYNRGGWFQNEQGYYDASTTGSSYLVVWESLDLVHWSEARLVPAAPANAGMAWAPEMIYHEETGEYIIFFASSIMNPKTKYKAKPNAIYYVATRDFVTYTEPKLFIDNQTDGAIDGKEREIIDTTVLRVGEYYYSLSKDGDNAEANGGIRLLKTKTLLDASSWEKVLDLDELGLDLSKVKINVVDNSSLEGPELFVINCKDRVQKDVPEYGMIADQYAIGAGYLPFRTTDLEKKDAWSVLGPEEHSFDKLKKRHGTVLRITKVEALRLEKAF